MRHNSFCAMLLGSVLILPLLSASLAAEVSLTVGIPFDELYFTSDRGYDRIGLPEGIYSDVVGAPMLPVRPVKVLIPAGATLKSVEATGEYVDLDGEYYLFPTQEPEPLLYPYRERAFVSPDEEIYSSSALYPGELIGTYDDGSLAGYRLVSLTLSPLQYIPAERKVRFYDRIDLSVTYTEAKETQVYRRSAKTEELYRKMVRTMVLNPEDVAAFSPPVDLITYGGKQVAAEDGFEYVIITTSSAMMDDQFQYLADWKTKKGVPAVVRTIEWIGERYPGRDLQEKIRNYLKVAHMDSGLVYVLLGGDKDVIPIRDVYFWDADPIDPPFYDTLPADHYYACLDGDWNADGDSVFGEWVDDVDFLPEVFVGRALASSGLDAKRTFIDKVFCYEKYRDKDQQYLNHASRIIFLSGDLFQLNDGCETGHYIDDLYIPDRFRPVHLCEQDGTLGKSAAIDSLNAGWSVVNLSGHGNFCTLCLLGRQSCTSFLDCDDMAALTNAQKYTGFFHTSACMVGGFDQEECIARSYVKNREGGGFFIGNTRYGWGGTEEFDRQIFNQIFRNDINHIGAALGTAKSVSGYADNAFIWTQYCLTLFGDPETPIWTYDPLPLSVSHQAFLKLGDNVPCEVSVEFEGIPLQGVQVCLDNDEYYGVAETESDGVARFSVTTFHEGEISVVATWNGAGIPYEGIINAVRVEEEISPRTTPKAFFLAQPAPTPFSSRTSISYDIPTASEVSLVVYDIVGRQVRTLLTAVPKDAGSYTVSWDGRDELGSLLPNGVYFCQLTASNETKTRRMTLIR